MTTNYAASIPYWLKKWEDEDIPWHKQQNHQMIKYIDKIVNGRSSIQIFFPMCGKSVDMKWFYDQGHKVVGVDCSEKAIKTFFTEQGLEYEIETVEKLDGQLFKTKDEKIKLFCCNIFFFDRNCAGLMDAVWDRGALVAVEKEDRKKFVQLMLSLLAPGYRYFLISIMYNDWFFSGFPKSVPDDLVHFLFDPTCSVNQLERNIRKEEKLLATLGVNYIEEVGWMITEKE